MQERGPYLKLSYAYPSPSRAARYARDFGGARLNLSYSAAADAKALEFSQSYSQVSLPVITNSKYGRQQLVYATKCVSVSSKREVRSRRATRKLLAGVRTTGPHACCATPLHTLSYYHLYYHHLYYHLYYLLYRATRTPCVQSTMALMDELSARLHRQDGASFNDEVLPLCSALYV
jgi:hypothetical protein